MWSLALPVLAVVATTPAPARTPAVSTQAPPRIEVAFVLDTTGSMGGLIEGAKRRIWTIARRIGEGRPRPELSLALVGYRDRGDEYVTRVHDFSGDMDEVYGHLMQFQANGGGDGPEHVTAALRDAVRQLRWSPGQRVVKLKATTIPASFHLLPCGRSAVPDRPQSEASASRQRWSCGASGIRSTARNQ